MTPESGFSLLHIKRVHTFVYTFNRGMEHYSSLTVDYTGWPPNNGTVDTVDFALINSYVFLPCWIEHLFLIKTTPRSLNLVENFFIL